MLGLPPNPGTTGTALLLLGLVLGLAAFVLAWRRGPAGIAPAAWAPLAAALAVALGGIPFIAWRIVEDMRFTTGLDRFQQEGAGPIHSGIQPYLLDGVARLLPPGATYFPVAGPSVRDDEARGAFGSFALGSLFPRVGAARPAAADWIVAWGVDPRTLGVPVGPVRTVRAAQGPFPPVFVARVR